MVRKKLSPPHVCLILTVRNLADVTGIAAADIVHDFLSMMQSDAPPPVHSGPFAKNDRDL